MVSVPCAHAGGAGGVEGGGRNQRTSLIKLLWTREGGEVAGRPCPGFTCTYTVPPSVTLSPISLSAGRPLTIKNGSSWSEHLYIYISLGEGGAAVAAVCAGVLALALHHRHLPPSTLPLPAHQDLPHSQVNISICSLNPIFVTGLS